MAATEPKRYVSRLFVYEGEEAPTVVEIRAGKRVGEEDLGDLSAQFTRKGALAQYSNGDDDEPILLATHVILSVEGRVWGIFPTKAEAKRYRERQIRSDIKVTYLVAEYNPSAETPDYETMSLPLAEVEAQ